MGTYELEQHPLIEDIKRMAPVNLIVIGAAEGYYAVGMASWPLVDRVIAFEAVDQAHALIFDMARLNDVSDKLDVHGLCDCSFSMQL